MTVLILFGSWHVGARLIHGLSNIKNVTLTGGSHKLEESIRLVGELNPNLVIVDAQMGEGTGIEVLRKVKSLSSPPVVIMTASTPYTQYRLECIRSGADFYFELPVEIDQLSKVVVDMSERSSAEDG